MNKIFIVSFDGLNRSGKGTQLKLLRKYFEGKNIPVQIVRGDGSRKGEGRTDYFDPESNWWKNWQNIKNKSPRNWDEAYHILSREIEQEFVFFSKQNRYGLFLMDRSHISRWFMERQRNQNTSFESAFRKNCLFPDIYFVLDAPQNILLSRKSDDDPGKARFRQDIVKKWYELWKDTMKKAKRKIGNSMVRVDATKNANEIHRIILNNLKSLYERNSITR